jgi:hypothetical protein
MMKDGKDENKSYTTSGIHRSSMLHLDKKKNNKCLSDNDEGSEK